ncbi:MAG: protoporphyrinogen oxidase [Planctomycetia bacterium]
MASPSPHIVVIGAGLGGLAAAEALLSEPESAAAGRRRVTIVEPSGRVGGVIATSCHDGWLVERSADSFLAARPEGVALVERLGLTGELIGVNGPARRALVLRDGRPRPVPSGFRLLAPGNATALLTTPILSPLGRLRVLAERFVPAGDPARADESLEGFAVRRLGREAFERLVQPLASGIWTADPARLSMAAACPEFFAMERRAGSLWAGERSRLRSASGVPEAVGARYGQFVTLASGMETLPRRLAARVCQQGADIVTAVATGVARGPHGRWMITLDGPSAAGNPLDADAVILAVPATAAARILVGCDAALAGELAGIDYAGASIVSLGFPRQSVAHPLDAAGLVVPRCERRRILAVSFSSQKFPGRAPADAMLMRTFVGGALDPDAAMLDDGGLTELVLAELRNMLGVRGSPLVVQIDRWYGAMPQYHVGHVERVERIHRLVAAHEGLALAGAAYEGVGIPQVIASGQAAAAAVGGRRGR